MLTAELYFISDAQGIRKYADIALNGLPKYFWKIPASSTGKYHPKYTLGDGGLVRHVQCAVRVAMALFEIIPFTQVEKDMIICALLLHDGVKKGIIEETYSKHEHPELVAQYLRDNIELRDIIPFEQEDIIINAIRTHMGKWSENNYSKFILERPVGKLQRFVHLCDYIASRKFLNMDLEA